MKRTGAVAGLRSVMRFFAILMRTKWSSQVDWNSDNMLKNESRQVWCFAEIVTSFCHSAFGAAILLWQMHTYCRACDFPSVAG